MTSNGTTNSNPRSMRRLTPGIIAPVPTFFLSESEDLGMSIP